MKLRQVKWPSDEGKVLRAGPSVQVCPIRCAKIRWKDKRFGSTLLAAYDQRLLFFPGFPAVLCAPAPKLSSFHLWKAVDHPRCSLCPLGLFAAAEGTC